MVQCQQAFVTGTVGCCVPVSAVLDTALLWLPLCLLHLGAACQPFHGVAAGVISQRACPSQAGSVLFCHEGLLLLIFRALAILSGS